MIWGGVEIQWSRWSFLQYANTGINITTARFKMEDSGSARKRYDARRDYNSAARAVGSIKTRSAIYQCHLYV